MDKILIIITTFFSSLLITPFVKKMAININSVDNPNERRVNKNPMPTLGGLAIFLSFMLGYILFGNNSKEMIPILLGGIIIVLTGVFDGIKPLKAREKFIGQLIGALILVLYGNMVITHIDGLGVSINFGIFAEFITIIFVLGMINAMNFIDGLDGLATGLSSIFFITTAVIAILIGKSNNIEFIFTLIMIGSSLGFLVHNFYPAKIYLGDSGSMFLGYIISAIAIMGFKNVTLTSFVVPLTIMAIPILDVFFAILRRVRSNKSISVADKKHIHHQVMNITKDHRKTVLVLYFINILFALSSIFYITKRSQIAIIFYILLFVITIVFVCSTTVLSDQLLINRKYFEKIKKVLKK